MTNSPTPAVLVAVTSLGGTIERWCTRDVATYDTSGNPTEPYTYAYTDFITGVRFAPGKCRELREALVRVAVEEVAI